MSHDNATVIDMALSDLRRRTSERSGEAVEAEAAPQKASLGFLLEQARRADDDMLDFELDLAELGADLRHKVDDIVEYVDYCRARSAAIGKRAKQLVDKAKAFANKADRLEEHVAFRLDEDRQVRLGRGEPVDDNYRLPGVNFEVALKYSERVTASREPDPALYLKLKGLVRRQYSWDLNAVKKALKANDAAVMPFAAITKHPFIKIDPKT